MTLDFRRILLPVSFDEASSAAVEVAGALARRDGGEVFLLHVILPAEISFPQQPFHLRDAPGEEKLAVEVVATQRLESVAAALGKGVRSHSLTRVGDPAARIIEAERELAIDLVVMPTHGRKGVAHLLLGSVAEAVVRRSACPVLTVRDEDLSAALVRG
jgi:universal stress protein A